MRFTEFPLAALALLLSAPLISAEDTDFELPACISACIKENPLSFDTCSDTIDGPSEQACVCGIVQFSAQCDCVDECSLEDMAVYAATIPGWCRYEFAPALTDEELEIANEESLSDKDWESFLDGPSVVELNSDLAGGDTGSETETETETDTETDTGDSDDQSVDDTEEAEEETPDDSSTEDTTAEDDSSDSPDTDAATGLAVPGFALAGAVLLALMF